MTPIVHGLCERGSVRNERQQQSTSGRDMKALKIQCVANETGSTGCGEVQVNANAKLACTYSFLCVSV